MKNSKHYLDKIINIIEKPYFKELGLYGVDDKVEKEYILSKIYGFDIVAGIRSIYKNITYRGLPEIHCEIYSEYGDGSWIKMEYDSRGNNIFHETNNGFWFKKEYDNYGHQIYYIDSNGLSAGTYTVTYKM